ncbi:hypothetical protein K456DRAFT_559045 [Colletotrichum gloeosporioides 23]|nr:hypothetical protein K456DRAFT_559045 [Colletotrichum gloeosporioides 23]
MLRSHRDRHSSIASRRTPAMSGQNGGRPCAQSTRSDLNSDLPNLPSRARRRPREYAAVVVAAPALQLCDVKRNATRCSHPSSTILPSPRRHTRSLHSLVHRLAYLSIHTRTWGTDSTYLPTERGMSLYVTATDCSFSSLKVPDNVSRRLPRDMHTYIIHTYRQGRDRRETRRQDRVNARCSSLSCKARMLARKRTMPCPALPLRGRRAGGMHVSTSLLLGRITSCQLLDLCLFDVCRDPHAPGLVFNSMVHPANRRLASPGAGGPPVGLPSPILGRWRLQHPTHVSSNSPVGRSFILPINQLNIQPTIQPTGLRAFLSSMFSFLLPVGFNLCLFFEPLPCPSCAIIRMHRHVFG